MCADLAQEAYHKEKAYYKKPTNLFVWHGSKEQKQLWIDVASGDMDSKAPAEGLWSSCVMYGALPLDTTQRQTSCGSSAAVNSTIWPRREEKEDWDKKQKALWVDWTIEE